MEVVKMNKFELIESNELREIDGGFSEGLDKSFENFLISIYN